jgi:ATP-binding cassette subfamily B protein
MSEKNPIVALFTFIRQYRFLLLSTSIFSILNKILDLMPPLLVGWVIATISHRAPHWISWFIDIHNFWHVAIFLCILAVLIFFLESVTQWAYTVGFMRLAQCGQHDLRNTAYRHIQSREMDFFAKHRLGETMAMLNDDINQLERFLNTGFNDLLQLATLIVFSVVVLFTTSWQLALIGLIPLPIIVWGSFYFQRKVGPKYKAVRQSVGELSSRLENNLSGMPVIQSFTAEEFEATRVAQASAEYRDTNFAAIKFSSLFVPVIRMAVAVGFGLVLLFGSYWVLNGINGLTVATVVVFSMLIQRLLWPFTRLGQTLDEYQRAKASAARTFKLLNTPSKIQSPISPKHIEPVKGEICFKDVSFAYVHHAPILNQLSFTIQAGQRVGIAGFSGAGKSTLIKLLLRFYEPQAGEVMIDGVNINDISLLELRRNIALVSQDVYLFHGSIAENIAYANGDATLEAIKHAAHLAELDTFIESLPEQYETIVGERGIRLSGGQRQRLSIARAALKDAPIVIFDEATSSVDTETERAIQQNMNTLTKNKTAIIIAHRLSTIRDADTIFVLEKGCLIEAGTHDQLVAKNGNYAELWKIQIGEVVSMMGE